MLTLDSFIESVDYLPPMPRNVTALINLLNQTDIDVDQVVELVQYDPAMTAQVIRLCNSAFFGGAPASDLHEATIRVGFAEIYQLVIALSTATLMRPQQKGYGIEAGELWKHCVTAALVGKFVAADRGADASQAFTACMLHDIGKVALSRSLEGKYDEVVTETKRSQCPSYWSSGTCWGSTTRKSGAGCWNDGNSRLSWSRRFSFTMTRSLRRSTGNWPPRLTLRT